MNPGTRETGAHALAHNMSAPPRSTFTFKPYGTGRSTHPERRARPTGLVWCLRVGPDVLLRQPARALTRTMAALRREALACARAQDKAGAAARIAEVRRLRLAGLVQLAAGLVGADPGDLGAPLEDLLDRLTDLARPLPKPPLPAMGVVELVSQAGSARRKTTTDLVAGLSLLTHLNGHTYDRDGPPTLAAGLAEGRLYDLITPVLEPTP